MGAYRGLENKRSILWEASFVDRVSGVLINNPLGLSKYDAQILEKNPRIKGLVDETIRYKLEDIITEYENS